MELLSELNESGSTIVVVTHDDMLLNGVHVLFVYLMEDCRSRGIIMLFETLAVIALIIPISASSAWGLRRDVSKLWYLPILGVGPDY